MEDPLNDHSQYPGLPSSFQSQSNHTVNNHDAFATTTANGDGDGSNYVPRPKRIACVVCRRRKLKCDGKKPSCGTCSRLGHSCAYDEVRKKSGPKRGYVKQLEARLAQVEMLLPNAVPTSQTQLQPQESNASDAPMADNVPSVEMPAIPELADDMRPSSETTGQPQSDQQRMPETGYSAWDMLSLGLEEPLPAQSVINELNQIFFEKVYPSIPIIHHPRYMAASNLAPNLRPPVHLQYIMWCHAAALTDKYYHLHGHFYQLARKYAEREEMRGLGENILSLAYCQTWVLVTTYESRMLYFPRAWLTTGKCGRLALMMGMNRLDRAGLNVKQSLPPPKDWTEREERRRTFWMVFCCDRYASIGTSWPMMIDERDIMTNLPASEEAFIKSKPEQTLHLADVLAGDGTSTLSPLGSVVLLASLFGRNLTHLHRPDPQDNDYDLNGEFWKRHRSYDNILLNIALQLPNHLRLPGGMDDPNVIFSNMCIHTSTICLHQAAIFKAERNKMPAQMVTESKRRCIVAADQISNIMKLISHTDLTIMNPFLSFCVYVAARVFVQYLKSRPDDTVVQSSLQFIVSALNALKNKNPLTETFLVQLDVDTEGMSLHGTQGPVVRDGNLNARVGCCQANARECPVFIGLPNPGTGDVAGYPLRDDKLASNTPHLDRHRADLDANRQKQTDIQRLNPNTVPASSNNTRRFVKAYGTITPGVEAAVPSVVDAEATPELFTSDNNNNNNNRTPSDHPTPSSLNSSSNASYPRTDPPMSQQPPPTVPTAAAATTATTTTTQAQAPISPLGISSSATATGSNSGPSSIAGQLYENNPGTPFYTGGFETSFTMPSPPTWDFATTQANVSSPGNMPLGTAGPFNEAQLEQLLSGTNWDAWRG